MLTIQSLKQLPESSLRRAALFHPIPPYCALVLTSLFLLVLEQPIPKPSLTASAHAQSNFIQEVTNLALPSVARARLAILQAREE